MAKPLPVTPGTGQVLPIVTHLPNEVYEGIGRVISAGAILELQVSELLFLLMRTQFAEGRVAFKYAGASSMFSTIRRLVDLHGITLSDDLVELDDTIRDVCCKRRDQLAHGIWVAAPDNPYIIGLRITEGKYQNPAGTQDAAFLPRAAPVTDFSEVQTLILNTAKRVQKLKGEAENKLAPSPEKSDPPSETEDRT